jgi:hypothetical protein
MDPRGESVDGNSYGWNWNLFCFVPFIMGFYCYFRSFSALENLANTGLSQNDGFPHDHESSFSVIGWGG